MTNLEKFYKLALNIVNDENKVVGYFDNDFSYIKVPNLHYEVLLNYSEPKVIELINRDTSNTILYAYESNPNQINEFLLKIRAVGFNDLLDGIE